MKIEALYPQAQTLLIKDGAGQPTDIKFQVIGNDSKPYRDATKKISKMMVGKDWNTEVDLVERSNAELVAANIISWEGLEDNTGPIPFSQTKAVELMLTPELSFLREQVEQFGAVRANFFRKSPKPA